MTLGSAKLYTHPTHS